MFFKNVLAALKAQGLPLLEKDAKLIVSVLVDEGSKALASNSNSIIKIVAGLLPVVKQPLLDLCDGIDGAKGN